VKPKVIPAPLASEPFHSTLPSETCPPEYEAVAFHGSTLFGHGIETLHDAFADPLVLVTVAS
jgi:hypothetical protein